MSSQNFQPLPALFTLGEIRLMKILYHEMSIAQLAAFFRKSTQDITELVEELELKKEEVVNG